MSKTAYIDSHSLGVVRACMGTAMLPETVLCQSAVESAWGQSLLASKYNNYFGIKAGSSWKGDYVLLPTKEYVNGQYITINAKFRRYSSFTASVKDYINFLKVNPRYKAVFTKKSILSQLQALQSAGYATDPNYANVIYVIYLSNKVQIDAQIKKTTDMFSIAFAGVGVVAYYLIRKYFLNR
jgi:flagellum-specific peptidoglycan hydrolase FlgJ